MFFFARMIVKNVFRARLRSSLTVLGLVVAIVAFGLLQTVVRAWYAGSDAASASRLVTRNSISLTFSMPKYYEERIRGIQGVKSVAVSNWFGGVWRDPRNFFAQFAVDVPTFFAQYPEFVVDPQQMTDLLRDRQGAAIGRQLADLYGFKVGDRVPLTSQIYPGNWEFTVRAIYDARDDTTITRQMYFHYDYLNETLKKVLPRRADQAGAFIVDVLNQDDAADIARRIDRTFESSLAETLTETEKAFQLSFVAMIESIVIAIKGVSYIVILIIMAVAANTMAMTARERLGEYATLKALGFKPGVVAALVIGEALALSLIGAGLAIALTPIVARGFHAATISVFARFPVVPETFVAQAVCGLVVGLVAGIVPALGAMRIRIVDGLRHLA
ncbi:ABC transporter permease [soil metagenome]